MRQHVDLVVLREDRLTQWFVDEFLRAVGYKVRPRYQPDLPVRGSGEQAVRQQFAAEVQRQRQRPDQRALLVISDGDSDTGADARRTLLLKELADGQPPPRRDERIALVIPVWEIENWVCYLRGSGFTPQKLDASEKRLSEADVREAARELAGRWQQQACPPDCPPELQQAREDFGRLQLAKS